MRTGRPKRLYRADRMYISIERICREYVEGIKGDQLSPYVRKLLLQEIKAFIENQNGSNPEHSEFIKQAKNDLLEIEIMEGQRIKSAEAKRALIPEPGKEDQILLEYISSLLPAHRDRLKACVVPLLNFEQLYPYQEAIEGRTGYWLRPAVFVRLFKEANV